MDHWKQKLEEIEERCEFYGLPKSSTLPKETSISSSNLVWLMNGSIFKHMSNMYPLRISSIVNLAWHNTLHIFGTGTDTVTITGLNNLDNQQFKLIPLILNHAKYSEMTIGDALKNIELNMENTLDNNLTLDPSEISGNFCDSFILLGDEKFVKKPSSPFSLRISEHDDSFKVDLSYNCCMFDKNLVDGMIDLFRTVLEKLVDDQLQNSILSSIEFLPTAQRKLIEKWNEATTGIFSETKRLHHLVEEAASRTPDKVAVICPHSQTQLTYQELNSRANQLGHLLHSKKQVKVEQLIALFLDKSEVLLITILGIWKSGAAYIPIDPAYPDERAKFILEDTGANILITNARHTTRLREIFSDDDKLEIIEDEWLLKEAENEPLHDLNLQLGSNQLAYVTYTSGTTGVPKGVYKEHKGVVNSITDLSIRYEMREQPEVVVLFSAYVFEPFIRQTLIALVNSQLLIIADDNEKLDKDKFLELMTKYKVTYLNGTGSVLQEYDLEKFTDLRKLILVGEELTKLRYDSLRDCYKGRLICEYGFTESALVTCMNVFDFGDSRTNRSIGGPLRNVKAYILNGDLNRVPVGAIGELYIGGVGISRGYMNRDNLSKQRFLRNPFQTSEEKEEGVNHLMYKTGDLARWIGNGQIEYLGRNDFQIKLRGNRIEPAEIESVVMAYPQVRKCTVVVKDSKPAEESSASSRHLVGYFVANQDLEEKVLIDFMEKKLPRYMIPVRMVQVDEIRTNINGKVDLKALPEVEFSSESSLGKMQKPRNESDSKLIKIWSDVLSLPEDMIGLRGDIFRLGGHSIICMQLIARIRQVFGCDVTIDNIFALRSVEKLSDFISQGQTQSKLPNQYLSSTLGQDERKDIIANSLQQGLVYHYLKQGEDDDAYTMQSHYRYFEGISPEIYEEAWLEAQRTFPSLRLNFQVRMEVYQIFRSKYECGLDWTFVNMASHPEAEVEVEINRIISEDRKKRYNLENGNLFRLYLIKENESKYSLVFSYHHIIIDGLSIPILLEFVHESYRRLLEGNVSDESVGIDRACLLSQKYFEEHRQDHLDYWTEEISRVDQRANLSSLLKPEAKYKVELRLYDQIQVPKELTLEIDTKLLHNLQNFGVAHGLTLHSILQFAWHKVLHTYGGGSHTIVGTTVSGRNVPVDGIQNSVGLFINTLPLVIDQSRLGNLSIFQAIKFIQEKVSSMNLKSGVELGKIGNGELKYSLFDSLFVLEPNMEIGSFLGFRLVKDFEKLNYPLVVIAREVSNRGLKITLCYAGELFEDEVIEDVLQLFKYFLEQVVTASAEDSVRKLELVLPNQLEVLDKWNQTKKDYPGDKTLDDLFEEVAASNPSKTALTFEDEKWTYDELNEKANQLARHLRFLAELEPDSKIALILKKNELLILSILGVWKAGAAFVPIDPSYPEERIRFMLEDTQAKLVIVNEDCEGAQFEKNSVKIVAIEDIVKNSLSRYDPKNLDRFSCSTALCYVIYTSGTTGKPKGVMSEHRGVANLHNSLSKLFNLRKTSKEEVILSFSNFVFDHFVEQMTDALLSGQTLVILNDEMRSDKERLSKYISENKVTYLSGTPSVLSLYDYTGLETLTRIDAVGEDFTEAYFNKIRSTFTSGIVINGYGPTETSITTHKRIYSPGEGRIDKSIGHQIDNSTNYILNECGQRLPIGAIGELHLGGIGVGRGYLNREDLTEKAFIENPFATEEDRRDGRNLRIYKTGDLARFLANGEVECLGRNDFQVKVRGLRIELSEIEAAILAYPGISQCVVVAQEAEHTSAKFLVGYYVAEEEGKRSEDERNILTFLQSKLPNFMMPNRLVQMKIIPVTINGKCDTKNLPKVKFISDNILDDDEGDLSMSEVERKLRFVWSELLALPSEQIWVDDDFFSLGGDSLLVTTMTFMISKEFGKVVRIPEIFVNKTVRLLAQFIGQRDQNNGVERLSKIESESEFAPISLGQERLLFIDELEGGTDAFNVPFTFKLKSKYCCTLKLIASLKLVVTRHESLRTLLVKTGDSYGQKVLNGEEFELVWPLAIKMTEVSSSEQVKEEVELTEKYIFKLDQDLPLRVCFIEDLERMETFVTVVFHHTCFDGWSFSLFQRDWLAFHKCLEDDEDICQIQIPKLTCHYKEFANFQKQVLTNRSTLESLGKYWFEKLENCEQLHLPTDFERPSKFIYSGYELNRSLNKQLTTALKNLAKMTKTSLFSVLAAATSLTMSIYTGQEEVLLGSSISNRIRPEFKDVIGFFVNILPLRFSVDQSYTVTDFIRAVGHEVVTSHVHQDMPFEKLVKDLKVGRDLSRHPLVQVMLNFNPLGGPVKAKIGERESESQSGPFELIEDMENKDTTAKYDLSITLTEKRDGLVINFTYAKMLFNQNTIEGYLNTFCHILTTFSQPENFEREINELDLVEEALVLLQKHKPVLEMPSSICECSTLAQLFEKVAHQCGPRIALVCNDLQLTYDQLNSDSTQVANLLLKSMLNGNSRTVALLMDKSIWMIPVIVGIWKAGGVYVPIDPSYPGERIKFILEDTESKLILSDKRNKPRLEEIAGKYNLKMEIIVVDELARMANSLEEEDFKKNPGNENDLAYIIYTSGSTGVPKGVKVTHGNVLCFREALLSHLKQNENVLFLSNPVFDFSIEQILLSIFNFGKLIIIQNDFGIDEEFYSYLNSEQLTYLSGTPSLISALNLAKLPHLETVTVAGEKFKKSQFAKMRKEFSKRLINAYGVTETTVYNSVSIFEPNDNVYRNSVGNFLGNTKYHLLDKHMRPLPTGAVAELYLSGPCLSQGYLNREDLSQQFFLPNLYELGELMYRTGDLVRLNSVGELEYLGRNDRQVKIRGFRVELEEIEYAVLKHEKIDACAVIFNEESLVCIYLSQREISIEELESFLEDSLLPAHMMPTRFLYYQGDSLPVTINGKLDTNTLKNFCKMNCSDSDRQQVVTKYSSARSPVEKNLCTIFSSVLDIPEDEIGMNDDFFNRLGGDSISSLLLAGKIRNQLGLGCTVKDIFEHRTIRKLCENLALRKSDKCVNSLNQVNGFLRNGELKPKGLVPLLPIQKWFFSKNLVLPHHYNQTFGIDVPRLDVGRLRRALEQLVRHHDAFRLRFKQGSQPGAGFIQHYEDDEEELQLNFHRLYNAACLNSENDIESQLAKWASSFDLERGPLYSVVYLEDEHNNKFKILWTIHHLIVDSVSWRILKDDLKTLYEGGILEDKGTSYKEFSLWLSNGQFSSEKEYWGGIVEKVASYNSKLTRVAGREEELLNLKFSFDPETSNGCLSTAKAMDTNIQDLLLVAVNYSLTKMTKSCVSYVAVEGHGRESGDLGRTLGWFTTMYPVEMETDGRKGIRSNIEIMNRSLRSIPNKGIGYGTLFGYVDPPLPCVSFNFLGVFGGRKETSVGPGWNFCDLALGLCLGDSGPERRRSATLIDITAAVDKGILKLSMDFLTKREVALDFIATFKDTLEEISRMTKDTRMNVIQNELPFGNYDAYLLFPSENKSKEKTTPTLFILPPGEGGAESYMKNLVPRLKKQCNLVLFNNYYLDNQDEMSQTTFENLASMYNKYVENLVGDGKPYNFLGWSFGGVLALEMSRQLLTSGVDHIQNLFIIDSYLNVGKAVEELNLHNDINGGMLIDRINYEYTPSAADFQELCSKTRNIVLFKATLENEMYKSKEQQLLYEYYRESKFNNLDTLIPAQNIILEEMKGYSHNSWVQDYKQVDQIASTILDKMLI